MNQSQAMMDPQVDFKPMIATIPGEPKSKGSLRSFRHKHTGKIITINPPKLTQWLSLAKLVFSEQWGAPLTGLPVVVRIEFHFLRPACHYGSGRNAGTRKRSAPTYHTQKPDVDKLCRAVLDALTGTCLKDDKQVAEIHAIKKYSKEAKTVVELSLARAFASIKKG